MQFPRENNLGRVRVRVREGVNVAAGWGGEKSYSGALQLYKTSNVAFRIGGNLEGRRECSL